MRMNLKVALAASALVGLGFLGACADSATAPASSKVVSEMNLALGPGASSTPEFGKIKICKTGNVGGSFDVTGILSATGTVSGLNTQIANAATCYVVAEDPSTNVAVGSQVSQTEDPPAAATTVSSRTACSRIDATAGNPVTACAFNADETVADVRFLNSFHGFVITYNNTNTPVVIPPPTGCTFTKGWYQNKNGAPTIVLTIDGRTPDQQRAIFEASPGQPGSVTWGTGNKPNNLLNLYQQLLAALNNLGGNALGGPASVDLAIANALAATGGAGLNITLVGTPDIGALITPLSNFNEGNVAGFPHCDD